MRLFVLAYPELAVADAAAIEAFRRRHDPAHAALVAAHFTLVFGVSGMAADTLAAPLATVAAAGSGFAFSLDRAVPFGGAEGPSWLFLKPGTGDRRFRALHRALNRPLHRFVPAGHLPAEQPFEPHLTIARAGDRLGLAPAVGAAANLPLPIRGRVSVLTLAKLEGDTLRDLAAFPLGG